MSYKIVKDYIPESKYNIKCPYTMEPEGVTVHNTANDADAKNEGDYMESNSNMISFHVAVDDKEVRLKIPFDRNAFHAGDGAIGRGNRKMIGVEICYSRSGGTRFTKAEKNAAAYIASILYKRGWGIDKVYRHKDFSGKDCPHRTMKKGWTRFKKMIQKELDALKEKEVPNYKVGNTYAIQCELTVRKNAGTKYEKKKHAELTKAGQKCDKDKDGAMDKGTKVTCKEIKKLSDGSIWMKIPSGWICAYGGKTKTIYVK